MIAKKISSKAKLLMLLREHQGVPVSGSVLAKDMGVSRVAVWKTVQALTEAGYSIETGEYGYCLDPKNEKDFLYPWEFGEKEKFFYHYKNTGSTMDRAREAAIDGSESAAALDGSVFTAEKQSAGRGRSGRSWISRQGGLFFTMLERPKLALADYSTFSLIMQIAAVRTISLVCGKKAYLRWPNDIYIDKRKIAGVTTEVYAEGDLIKWISIGLGLNINNPVPSGKATSCAEITGSQKSRKGILINILNEAEKIKKTFSSQAAYSQGNRALASEWNSLADCIGAKAVVFEPEEKNDINIDMTGKILARGNFSGIDPAGRCILKTDNGDLYFNQGSVSLAFLNP
jgi:BirA family biotin operon repressor/biotin-[acetyl-CoA-carboxylase] ligase